MNKTPLGETPARGFAGPLGAWKYPQTAQNSYAFKVLGTQEVYGRAWCLVQVKVNVFMIGVGLIDPEILAALQNENSPPEITPLSEMDKSFANKCLQILPRVQARYETVAGLNLQQLLLKWGDRRLPSKEEGLYLFPAGHLGRNGRLGDASPGTPTNLMMFHLAEADDELGEARTLARFARIMATAPRSDGGQRYSEDEIARLLQWLIADSRLI